MRIVGTTYGDNNEVFFVTFRDHRFCLRIVLILGLMISIQALISICRVEASSYSGTETINWPQTNVIAPPPLSASDQSLLDLIKVKNYAAAKQILQARLGEASHQDRAELRSLLAYVDLELNGVASAAQDLSRIDIDSQSIRQRILTLKRTADLDLKQRKESQARQSYRRALSFCGELDRTDPVIIDVLSPLIGCLLRKHQYSAAEPYAQQLLDICRERAKSGELYDVASLFYAYVDLLQVYSETDTTRHRQLLAELMPLLDELIKFHTKHEGNTPESATATFQQIQDCLLASYVAVNKPQRLSEFLWLSRQFRVRSLPLIEWQPNGGNPKAVILCIHALGLENRAFMPFGREMAKRGFVVYAMDVRGFGAWQSEYGSESVDFERALADIQIVTQIAKARQPKSPVFLLGESMGGALVLQAAAEFGNELGGIITSAPSAERYGEAKMAARVAFHLFQSPHKPFDIVTGLAQQATSKQKLIDLWKQDPKARAKLTPAELLEFDRFMNRTTSRCSLIQDTFVLVVQGLADKLVKPQGTYEIFDRISSSKKAMIIIGDAEHLIFETTDQSRMLLEGLCAWLDNCIDAGKSLAPK